MTSRKREKKKRSALKPQEEWDALQDITADCAPEFLETMQRNEPGKLRGVYRSSLYEVYAYALPTADGQEGSDVTYLSIKRRDKEVIRDWRHLQQIKNEICDPECEAMELYPAESRLVDTSNQFHLWVMPLGFKFPFGYVGRCVVSDTPENDYFENNRSRQRPHQPGLAPKDALSRAEADERATEYLDGTQ